MISKESHFNGASENNVGHNCSPNKIKHDIFSNCKKYAYRQKLVKSLCIAVSFLSMGLMAGQLGPVFLDLQILTNTNVEQASAFFTGGSVGSLIGSLCTGAFYNKVRNPLLSFLALTIIAGFTLVNPYCTSYLLVIAIRTVIGFFVGYIGTFGNTEHLRIWGSEGQVLMQLLHFSFAFGAVVSPLYSSPFLSIKSNHYDNNTSLASPHHWSVNTTDNITMIMNSTTGEDTTNIHWAFIITSVGTMFSAVPFLILYLQDTGSSSSQVRIEILTSVKQRKLPKKVLIATVLIISLFYLLYSCVHDSVASFLVAFLVKEYSYVSKSKASYVVAIFWASLATGRFSMIFFAKFFKLFTLLSLSCVCMLVSLIGFSVSAVYASTNPQALYAIIFSCVMLGLSCAAVYPSGLVWAESDLIKITGPISSCIIVLSSLGAMVNPLLLSYLMEEINGMWFCYYTSGAATLECCVLFFLWFFNKSYLNNVYGSLRDERNVSLTLQVSEPLNTETSNVGLN